MRALRPLVRPFDSWTKDSDLFGPDQVAQKVTMAELFLLGGTCHW